jgi:hypothetical protein
MEIISEPTYIEDKFTRYDYGFVGDVLSFNFHDSVDTADFLNGFMTYTLHTPPEIITINFTNVLWWRKTPQTLRKLVQTPPLPTP